MTELKIDTSLNKEEKKEGEEIKVEVTDFFHTLFQLRDAAHLRHLYLQPELGSFAEHIALKELYKGVLKLTDSLIESYQGMYGLVDMYIPETKRQDNSIEMIEKYCKYLQENRIIFKESFIQNQIDEIEKLNYQTLFKLKQLK